MKIYFTSTSVKSNELFDDSPWEEGNTDELNRFEAAKSICKRINNFKGDKSFSIGIIGGWGEGKTSFFNMITSELSKNIDNTIIHFNPWKSTDSKLIQKDFFSCLKVGLSPFSSEIYPALNKYIKILFQYDKSKISNFLSTFVQEQNQVYREFDNVNKAIRRINRKIIVCIDDIDRLDSKEIFEVIKIVRNTGNFSNIIFLAAYDKNYVNVALAKFTTYKNDTFLEKIFQQEITLPSYPSLILTNKLIGNLKEYYKNDARVLYDIESKLKFKPDDYNLVLGWTGSVSSHVNKFITNIRDIKRLTNSFIHSFTPIREDVELIDFFHLELLKLKAYPFFEAVKNKSILKSNKNNWSAYTLDNDKYKKLCGDLEADNIEEIKDILLHLFPEDCTHYDARSICFQKSFLSYFTNQLFNRLSRAEFNRLFTKETQELKDALNSWIEKGYLSDILEYLNTTPNTSFLSKEEFINYLQAWFWLVENGYDVNIDYLVTIFEKESKEKFAEKYFEGDSDEIESFFKEALANAEKPYHVRKIIYKLIANYQYNHDYQFLLTEDELKKQAIEYLNKFLQTESDLTNEGMWLYYTCVDHIDGNRRVHLIDGASSKMKEFIEKNSTYYLDNFIRPLYSPDDGNHRTGEPFASSIFGSYDSFEEFLNNKTDYPRIGRIKKFFEKFKRNNYNAVYFENPEKELK